MPDSDDPKKRPPRNPHDEALPQNERAQALETLSVLRPPRTSPTTPGVELGDATWNPPTGEHPVTKNELKRWGNLNDVRQVVAMIVVAVATVFGAYKFVLSDAAAQSDAKQAVLEEKHTSLKHEVDQIKFTTDASITALRDELKQQQAETRELRTDVKEFYRAWRDDKRSSRLDTALLDGGR